MIEPRSTTVRDRSALGTLTVFLCVNCARPGVRPGSAGRAPPAVPDLGWPAPVEPVLLPCTGRLQPEHVLKAFEAGADAVCAVGCREDNCHHVEGSRRCARRVEHVRGILDAVGLGGERLLFFTLPGSAAEDLALGAGRPTSAGDPAALAAQLAGIREAVTAALRRLPASPLRRASAATQDGSSPDEVDPGNDDNDD